MALSKEEQPPPAGVVCFQVARTKRRLFPSRSHGAIRDGAAAAGLFAGSFGGAVAALLRPLPAALRAGPAPRGTAPPARLRCSGPTSWRPAAQREASPGATRPAAPRGRPGCAAGSDGCSLAGAAAADPVEGLDAALAGLRVPVRGEPRLRPFLGCRERPRHKACPGAEAGLPGCAAVQVLPGTDTRAFLGTAKLLCALPRSDLLSGSYTFNEAHFPLRWIDARLANSHDFITRLKLFHVNSRSQLQETMAVWGSFQLSF